MATKQFMTLDNLTTYDGLIKQYIGTEDAKSIKAVALDGTSLKFYDVESPTSQTQPKYTINLPSAEGFIPLIDDATGDKVVVSNSDGSVSESSYGIWDATVQGTQGLVVGYLNTNDYGDGYEGQIFTFNYDYDSGTSRLVNSGTYISDFATGYGGNGIPTGYLLEGADHNQLNSSGIKADAVVRLQEISDEFEQLNQGYITVGNGATLTSSNVKPSDLATNAFVGEIPQGSSATTVIDYVDEVAGSITTASDVTLVEAQTPTTGYLKTYELYQGGNAAANLVGKIDIPKDLVVTSGEIVVNPTGQPAGTYLKLTIANQTTPVYINVADLCDAYTAASGATQVQLAISNTNEISATLVAGAVGTAQLANRAVTEDKIEEAAVTSAKLAVNSVTQAIIANDAVTADKVNIAAHTEKDENELIEVTTTDGQVSGVTFYPTSVYDFITGYIAEDISTAVENLDATVSQSAGNDGLALQVVEADGVLTSVTGSIAANTYDSYGAASTVQSTVIGTSGDAASANTVYGAKAYADASTAAISTADINALFNS